MTVRKDTEEIIDMVFDAHDAVENILKLYLDEYADYGWDSMANELTGIIAQLEVIKMELLYATVKKGCNENDKF